MAGSVEIVVGAAGFAASLALMAAATAVKVGGVDGLKGTGLKGAGLKGAGLGGAGLEGDVLPEVCGAVGLGPGALSDDGAGAEAATGVVEFVAIKGANAGGALMAWGAASVDAVAEAAAGAV